MSRYRLNFVLLFGVYGFSYLYIIWRHYKNIRDGGHKYLQGDWLINFADGPVRRGLSGEAFLKFGEFLNFSPLVLLGFAQAIILAFVIGTLLYVAVSKGLTDSLTLALLSPVLVLFWVNDQFTPFRKELLGYLVFVPLFLLRSSSISTVRLVVASFLFSMAVLFHEANAIFFVPFALVLWALLERKKAVCWIVLNGISCLLGTIFSMLHMSVPSVDGICARVVDSGASPRICEGSMTWLSKDFQEVIEGGWQLVAMFGGAQNFILAMFLVSFLFGIVALLLKNSLRDRETVFVLVVGIGSITPLFAMGGDWGRWVSIQMFVALFLFLGMAEKRACSKLGGAVSIVTYTIVLVFNFSIGVFHMVPTPKHGFAHTFVTAIQNFLS